MSPEAEPTPDMPERTEEAGRATIALGKLRSEQQRVLQLAIYHGCSHEEIARCTGLPLGTVKTHARRGLIRLREILESEGALQPARPDAPDVAKVADQATDRRKKPQ